jgi:hypothetical protein
MSMRYLHVVDICIDGDRGGVRFSFSILLIPVGNSYVSPLRVHKTLGRRVDRERLLEGREDYTSGIHSKRRNSVEPIRN